MHPDRAQLAAAVPEGTPNSAALSHRPISERAAEGNLRCPMPRYRHGFQVRILGVMADFVSVLVEWLLLTVGDRHWQAASRVAVDWHLMAGGIVSHLQAAAGSSAQLAIGRRFRLAWPGVLDQF